jgi:CPA2 family monovalent cation:H+ antiporter-2
MPTSMTAPPELLLTLAGGLTAALIFGAITHRLHLSPVVGYLIAGLVVGPFTPGIVADRHVAEQLAELGVVLLMFGVGAHFRARDLLAVWRLAVPGAIVQTSLATVLAVWVTSLFGWSTLSGVVLGLAIGVASTVVLIRVLSDNDALHTRVGHVAVGWLLVEDLFTVLVLVLLPALGSGGSGPEIGWAIGAAVLKVAALVAFTFLVGTRAIPALLRWVARTRSRELFTLAVLALALGIAVGSALLFGASMALGAFLAGMVVGQSELSARAMSEALPMRDAFAVLFFVAMGMLLDPMTLPANVGLVLATLAIVLIGKPLAALIVVLAMRHPLTTALPVAVALAQIGEFSFILAQLALGLDLLPPEAMQALVATAIISITLNPFLYRRVEPLAALLSRRPQSALKRSAKERAYRAVVVGYGPVGRTLVCLLREHGLEPTVIEMNYETVRRLNEQGIVAVHGDASRPEILEAAGLVNAAHLVFAASGSPRAAIDAARQLDPNVRVIARTTYAAEAPVLRRAGAEIVIAAEVEVAFAMTERLLEELGATPDQFDRARDRVREELAESSSTESVAEQRRPFGPPVRE